MPDPLSLETVLPAPAAAGHGHVAEAAAAGDYRPALTAAIDAALVAGDLLRADFDRGPAGGGAHAEADDAAEAAVRARLLDACPTWHWLGEETGARAGAADESHAWVVDPNDGTAAYLKGQRGSAVAIGLLRDGLPVLGVVFAFAAPDHGGDLFAWAEGCPFERNGRPVERAAWPDRVAADTVVVLAPGADRTAADNAAAIAPARFRALPSIAYRLALVAAGEGDVAVSLHGPGGWDLCAGHALLRGVGGVLVDESGREVTYTRAGQASTRRCFGGGAALVHELVGRPWSRVHFQAPKAETYDLVRPRRGDVVADAGLLARAQGCLLGQVAGDALGSLVEFSGAAEIARRYPGGPRKLADGGYFDTLAGQPTDDSELALILARATVEAGGPEPEALAAAYRYWLDSRPFDVGGTIGQALRAITADGLQRRQAAVQAERGAKQESQANGALMRCSPLGVWGHALDPVALAEHARRDARLTHPHPVCQDASAVYVVAVAFAVRTGAPAVEVCDFALHFAKDQRLQPAVVERLERADHAPPDDYQRHMGWVLTALQDAFYRLRHAPDPEQGVVATVASGGDTDTNGAITGALLGAVHGRDALPRQWRQKVLSCRPVRPAPWAEQPVRVKHPRPRAFWPVDALVLAERLLLAGRAIATLPGKG